MTKASLWALAALTLAGCGGTPETPSNVSGSSTAGNSAAGNVTAIVMGYDEKQRNGVFARAIIDANLTCDAVLRSERVPDQNGLPAWKAYCKNGLQHIVSITPDGTAVILSAPGS